MCQVFCAIRTADNTDGKSRKSIVSEKSPSFRHAPWNRQAGHSMSDQRVFCDDLLRFVLNLARM